MPNINDLPDPNLYTGPEYAELLRWHSDHGMPTLLNAFLRNLPANHPHWDDVIGEFGESTLIGLGVDI